MVIIVTRFAGREDSVQIYKVNEGNSFIEVDPDSNRLIFFDEDGEIRFIELVKGDRYVIRGNL